MNNVTEMKPKIDPMEWLFSHLIGTFGNPFLDKFRSKSIVEGKDTGIENMKVVWSDAIRENKLTMADVRRGLDGCKSSKFAPSLGEFLELCKPNKVDVDMSFYEAVDGLKERANGKVGTWSHPAIFWAASRISNEIKTQPLSAIRKRWEFELKKELAKNEWPAVPAPVAAIENNPSPANKEVVQRAVKQASNALDANSKINHRAWIGRIIEKDKAKPGSVPSAVLAMAKEALAKVGGSSNDLVHARV